MTSPDRAIASRRWSVGVFPAICPETVSSTLCGSASLRDSPAIPACWLIDLVWQAPDNEPWE
jgi:hypothetical protein